MSSIEAKGKLKTGSGELTIYRLDSLNQFGSIDKLPYSSKGLLENLLRNIDGSSVTEDDVIKLAGYKAKNVGDVEIAYCPARVLLQDFTGVPLVVDLAAMRDAMKKIGGDPQRINPLVPVDLVVDHSVQVDAFASGQARELNAKK